MKQPSNLLMRLGELLLFLLTLLHGASPATSQANENRNGQPRNFLEEISDGVYRVNSDLDPGKPLRITADDLVLGEPLEIIRTNRNRPAKVSYWNGNRFRVVDRAPAGDESLEIPANLVEDQANGFLIESGTKNAAIILSETRLTAQSSLIKLTAVTLVNKTSSPIAFMTSTRKGGHRKPPLQALESDFDILQPSESTVSADAGIVTISVKAPASSNETLATLSFRNPFIGYPSASGTVANRDVSSSYSEGENKTYRANGFRLFISRERDSDTKNFTIEILKD